jgi:hypothetical protein
LLNFIHKDLKYISQYLPNNKCDEDVDHHDHENETEHLHQHSNIRRESSTVLKTTSHINQKSYTTDGNCSNINKS